MCFEEIGLAELSYLSERQVQYIKYIKYISLKGLHLIYISAQLKRHPVIVTSVCRSLNDFLIPYSSSPLEGKSTSLLCKWFSMFTLQQCYEQKVIRLDGGRTHSQCL